MQKYIYNLLQSQIFGHLISL